MMRVTAGVNTHRGAIWALGLLIAGCAATGGDASVAEVAAFAAALARMPDRFAKRAERHGAEVRRRFGAGGAMQQACEAFPHVLRCGLPALRSARSAGHAEPDAQILSLLAIMATLDDTCLLYRAGPKLLRATKQAAWRAYERGGNSTATGRLRMQELDGLLRSAWASPGGSADLFAATLFLDRYASQTGASVSPSGRPIPCRN